MKFTSQKRYFFVPDINGNLKLDEKEQLQIEIIRATAENQGLLSKVTVKRQTVHELLLGKPLLSANFRRKVMPLLTAVGRSTEGDGHRPAAFFTRNKNEED